MKVSGADPGSGNRPTRVLLVGVGPHARRFYLPALKAASRTRPVEVAGAVELTGQGASARDAVAAAGFPDVTIMEVEPFDRLLPPALEGRLDELRREARIDAVIVATEPMAHVGYALWAIERDLPLVLDKPISARRDAISDPRAAIGIAEDFDLLAAAYRRKLAGPGPRPVVSVCAHRRFHPGIAFLCEQIEHAARQTGCPVTSIHCHHSDGQWRFPGEMLTQEHHSYHHGHGKASHSGHHFLDSAWMFWQAGARGSRKRATDVSVFAAMTTADAHVQHLTHHDYRRLFGDRYDEICPKSDAQLLPELRRCGELDVSAIVSFRNDGVSLCNASFDLQHTGFSRRAWPVPPVDLYKGNGRVKHEEHRVHVGPFRALHVHSYQAVDEHDTPTDQDLLPGGRNHYDITVYTNTAMLGGVPVQRVSLAEISDLNSARLHIEQIKDGVVDEFLRVVRGELDPATMRSGLLEHEVPTSLLSALYRSHIAQRVGGDPVIGFHLPSP